MSAFCILFRSSNDGRVARPGLGRFRQRLPHTHRGFREEFTTTWWFTDASSETGRKTHQNGNYELLWTIAPDEQITENTYELKALDRHNLTNQLDIELCCVARNWFCALCSEVAIIVSCIEQNNTSTMLKVLLINWIFNCQDLLPRCKCLSKTMENWQSYCISLTF